MQVKLCPEDQQTMLMNYGLVIHRQKAFGSCIEKVCKEVHRKIGEIRRTVVWCRRGRLQKQKTKMQDYCGSIRRESPSGNVWQVGSRPEEPVVGVYWGAGREKMIFN